LIPPVYRVYVLQNLAGKFYIGLTEDIVNRLVDHNADRSRWTRGKGPWQLVWKSEELALGAARKLENRLKRQGRGSGFYSITGISPKLGS
jgi:putative endonuclease